MGQHFRVSLDPEENGFPVLRVGIGDVPANKDVLVREALAEMNSLPLTGGAGLKIWGQCPLPVAVAMAHKVAHLYGFIACFDPMMAKYIVAISHHPDYAPGDLID